MSISERTRWEILCYKGTVGTQFELGPQAVGDARPEQTESLIRHLPPANQIGLCYLYGTARRQQQQHIGPEPDSWGCRDSLTRPNRNFFQF
jgi:hypothetical protein